MNFTMNHISEDDDVWWDELLTRLERSKYVVGSLRALIMFSDYEGDTV